MSTCSGILDIDILILFLFDLCAYLIHILSSTSRHPIEGKDVLIVEDIIDTGHTLGKLQEMFRERNAKSVKTAVLARKKECVQVCWYISCFGVGACAQLLDVAMYSRCKGKD